MSKVIHKITLDIHKRGTQVFISAFRGDTLRTIIASLTESGKPYIIPEGCTVVFTAIKPDGNYLYNDCTIDTTTNSIVYDFTSQTTVISGEVKCQFKLIDSNGGILAAPLFSIVVGDTLYNEEPIIESSSEYNALTEYMASLPDRCETIINEKLASEEFKGEKGDKGDKGDTYILTDNDRTEIANEILASLPNASGVIF